ncbi:MAG TPA: AAA family ATPase [Roseiflexaceae bacterium]|nr:AAA family ATPase [Roseiflexaceae bacterium]
MNTSLELSPDQLYCSIDRQALEIQPAEQLTPLIGIIGQPRAVAALRFGLEVHDSGFNLYVAGPPGIGKMTAVRTFLEQVAGTKTPPADWCYVHNFDDPYQPQAHRLPAGRGRKLQQDMQHTIAEVRRAIARAFEGEAYNAQRAEIGQAMNDQREALLARLNERATQDGFLLRMTPMGIALIPAANGRPLSDQEFDALPEAARAELLERHNKLQVELEATLKEGRAIERAAQDKLQELDRQVVLSVVGGSFEDLGEQYRDLPEIAAYLQAVQNDIQEHSEIFRERSAPAGGAAPEGMAVATPWLQELPFRKYQVNMLVDNSKQSGAPVVVEINPSYPNLFGRIEKETLFGALSTDFTLIKAGSLHQASGGYLVLPIQDLLRNPFSWDALKRALRSHAAQIEDVGERMGFVATKGLRPQPIPLDVKVVLVGPPLLYDLLSTYDEAFPELFKVRADFDTRMERSPENIRQLTTFFGTFCAKEQLKPLDASGVARLLEHATRLAEDQAKFSAHVGALADVIREAQYWTDRAGVAQMSAAEVQQAIDAKVYRSSQMREHIQELIANGTLLIDTAGACVGQVNGLSVVSLGDYEFGRPSRITASVGPGKGDIVDIEREVALGGPIHSKGMLILSGYLRATYAHDLPLTLSARLVFEQSYAGVEGDSASSAELYALLSALAGLPIKQGIAVTGSVNQHGEIQAIGGVNQKIEGFFEVCQARGLTGEQGVLIPRSNLRHLMLRADVVDAVRAGQFHIWAISTIGEGIELLTGMRAGTRQLDGEFPDATVNGRVNRRLREFAASVSAMSEPKPAELALV